MRIHGWGGYRAIDATVHAPTCATRVDSALSGGPLIARGMGRSYGDSANAGTVLQTTYLDHFVSFDAETGRLTCEAGVTIRQVLALIVPKGWFLAVTPGSSHVTIGGAIASDVHGKNHHSAGTFCRHVESMSILLGTGDVVTASPDAHADLFQATCGGMGLTGVVLDATLRLVRIGSSDIVQTTVRADNVEAICDAFERHASATYSVAWIDCVARGRSLGRSVLMLGEQADTGRLAFEPGEPLMIPLHAPASLLNRWTVRSFNALYYARAGLETRSTVPLETYFYPLDGLGRWNRLYGKAGFVQYQFVIPKADGVANLRRIIGRIADAGVGSFLAVLKQFGAGNDFPLSFPFEGYTLALDFKVDARTLGLLRELDAMLVAMGGRIYLTKDALMSEATFKAGYPRWHEFEAVRASYGAIGRFASEQSRRLGLQ